MLFPGLSRIFESNSRIFHVFYGQIFKLIFCLYFEASTNKFGLHKGWKSKTVPIPIKNFILILVWNEGIINWSTNESKSTISKLVQLHLVNFTRKMKFLITQIFKPKHLKLNLIANLETRMIRAWNWTKFFIILKIQQIQKLHRMLRACLLLINLNFFTL